MASTDPMTVTMHNYLVVPELQNVTYTNITGSFSHSYNNFETVNPFCPFLQLQIIEPVCLLYLETNETLISCETPLVASEVNGNLSVKFPSHCDYMREYSFSVKALTSGFFELTAPTVLKSYNSLTLNPDFDYPMVIEIYGVDQYNLDLRPYFIHSNPECEIVSYIITSVF